MTELADRFTLTTGPDGRVLLTLALRCHPGVSADGFAPARRYWACAPGGAQPRWLEPAADPDVEARTVAEAHAAAVAYVPGVSCSGCGDRVWKPADRAAVTRYVRTGGTGECLTCRKPPVAGRQADVEPVAESPAQSVEAWNLPVVTVRVDGTAAAMLWSATGGDMRTMSSLVTELISRNFGLRRPDGVLV